MISEKIEQLKELTDWFYGPDFSLDEALGKYTEAARLAKEIEADLDNLKNEIELVEQNDDATAAGDKSKNEEKS